MTDIDLRGAEFTSIAVYSDMEQLGSFECSDQRVNQLVRNSVWSLKSNFCDVPTDCPTRERAAWTGDMGVFAGTGIFLADCYPVIRKWLGECRLNQYEDGKVANIAPKNNVPGFFSGMLAGSVGWGDACIIVPYTLYQRYGDRRILEENYEMMKKWYRFLEGRAKQKPLNPILDTGKALTKILYSDDSHCGSPAGLILQLPAISLSHLINQKKWHVHNLPVCQTLFSHPLLQ